MVGRTPAALAVSANGTQNGILWATTPDNVLHAFNGTNVAVELWNSNPDSSRDALPAFVKFAEPTVANGRVYVATSANQLAVYGLLSDFALSAAGSLSVAQGGSVPLTVNVGTLAGFSGAVSLSVTGLPPGATATFSPIAVNGTGFSTATINTSPTTPTGTYNLLVSGTAAGETRTVSVALTVTIPTDVTPPQATCCTYTISGSSYVVQFTGQDTGTGLKSIIPAELVDATASIPPFPVGTKNIVTFTAAETGWDSYAKFQLTDVAGNNSFIDLLLFDPGNQPERQTGTPLPFAVKSICKANACPGDTYGEGIVTIENGSPGVKNLRIQVNDGLNLLHIEVAGLKDNEYRFVDISSLLPSNRDVTVEITFHWCTGRPSRHPLWPWSSNAR